MSQVPKLNGGAARLLAVAEGLPDSLGERERLILGLDIVASDEWSRVVVRSSAEDVEGLRPAAVSYTPNELNQVVSFARAVAGAYGFEHTEMAHIAIGLVLTARGRDGFDQLRLARIVAESFWSEAAALS
jgi:hypothetical protein